MIFPESLLGVSTLGGLCRRKGIGVVCDKRKVVKDDLYRFSIFFQYLFQGPLGLLACRALEIAVLYDLDFSLRGSLDRISLTVDGSNPRYAGNEVSNQDDRHQDSNSDPGPAFGPLASVWSWSCGFLRSFSHGFSVWSVVFRQRLTERRGGVNFTEVPVNILLSSVSEKDIMDLVYEKRQLDCINCNYTHLNYWLWVCQDW